IAAATGLSCRESWLCTIRVGAGGTGEGSLQHDRNRLCARRAGLRIIRVQRYERVCLRIVSGAGTVRYVVRYDYSAPHYSLDCISRKSVDIHSITFSQVTFLHFGCVQKQHVALIENATITVAVGIDSSVVLIVTADRAQPEHLRIVLVLVFV